MKPVLLCLTAALAIGLAACDGSPVEIENEALGTLQAKGGGGGGGGGGRGLLVSMSGDLFGDEQAISGKNDNRTLSAKGDYTLEMRIVDVMNLACSDLPGTIPDERGLVALVQKATPRPGTLDLKYDKTGPHAGRVDSWTTTIGQNQYQVQLFGWTSADLSENGVTTVSYRGASIMVFKKKGKRILSREQCFGDFVDYDLIVN